MVFDKVREYLFKTKKANLGKYLIIPDIHGTYSIYKKIEDLIKKSEKDRVIIFLGDYLDRGESGEVFGKEFKDAGSYFVIRDLIELKKWADKNKREMIFLRGNHELFYEDYFLNNNKSIKDEYEFVAKTVEAFEYIFKKDKSFYDDFIEFLNDLKAYYLDEKYNYLFIHAGVDPDIKSLDKQVEEGIVYWIRDKFLFSKKRLDYTVVFGHTPFLKPYMRSDKIGLDSGVYKRDFFNILKIDKFDSKIIKLYK